MAAKESRQPLPGLATDCSPSESGIGPQLEKILTSPPVCQFAKSAQLPPLHRR